MEKVDLETIYINKIIALWTEQLKRIWHPDELNPVDDLPGLDKLDESSMILLAYVLAFFRNADEIVADNIKCNFNKEFNNKEINRFYNLQVAVEDNHQLVYDNFINTYRQNERFNKHFENAEEQVINKILWIKDKTTKNIKETHERLLYFITIEGIMFAASFLIIYWFRNNSKLVQLCNSNEWIANDEGLHTQFGISLYLLHKHKNNIKNNIKNSIKNDIKNSIKNDIKNDIKNGIKKDNNDNDILRIIKESVNMEKSIMDKCFNEIGGYIGFGSDKIDKDGIIKYIQYISDNILVSLGEPKHYNIDNPYTWAVNIPIMTNFFEEKETNYQLNVESLCVDDISKIKDLLK